MLDVSQILTLKEAGFIGGFILAIFLYHFFVVKKNIEEPKKHEKCIDCNEIKNVIKNSEENNKILIEVLKEVKKNNKLQQLQLMKGIDENELDRIVSLIQD